MTKEEKDIIFNQLSELEERHPAFAENVRDNAYCEAIADVKRIIDGIKEPSIPSDLDEVTMDFARELDFFLYGSYTPERFPNSMQVRDEHSGLKVNDWKCWVNRPEYRIEMVKHFFTLGKQVGAEWMAGQGVSLSHLIAWYIQSVDAHEPVWTKEHLEELVKDYILIPKN